TSRSRNSATCSRMVISAPGLAGARRSRMTGSAVCLGQDSGFGASGAGGRGRVVGGLGLVPVGLAHALLELLDALADVAADQRQAACPEDHHDDEDDPNPLRSWHDRWLLTAVDPG